MMKVFLAALLLAFASSATSSAGIKVNFQNGSFTGVVNIGGSDPSDQGKVKVTTTATGRYTISGNVGPRKFRTSGSFEADGTVSKQIVIKFLGFVVATIDLDLQLAADGESIDATVKVNDDTYSFTLYRAFYSKDNKTTVAGYHTARIASPGAPLPEGTGYASVTVKPTGSVKVVGRLADGTAFSSGGTLFKDDRFAIANILYRKRGALGGFVDFSSNDAATGSLAWVRLEEATPDVLTPAAFSGNVTVQVSRYTPPTRGTIALPGVDAAGAARVDLAGGNLVSSPLKKDVTISTANRVSVTTPGTENLTVTIKPKTGLVSGKATVNLTTETKRVTFRGMILQSDGRAEGHFVGTDKSGIFSFFPLGE